MRIEFIDDHGLYFIFEEHEAAVLKGCGTAALDAYLWGEVARNRDNLLVLLRELLNHPSSTLKPRRGDVLVR